jgi:K+-transporting ATPase A subunit
MHVNEQRDNPLIHRPALHRGEHAPGGNMEGKGSQVWSRRFSVEGTVTSNTATGSTDAMDDSFTSLRVGAADQPLAGRSSEDYKGTTQKSQCVS